MQTFPSDHSNASSRAQLVSAQTRPGDGLAKRTNGIPVPLNLARFDFVTFYLVVLCAELGSLCEAARFAHISKSAASHRITTLEDHIGKKLFHRHHNGLELTDAGALCVERGRKILEEVRGLKHRLASM